MNQWTISHSYTGWEGNKEDSLNVECKYIQVKFKNFLIGEVWKLLPKTLKENETKREYLWVLLFISSFSFHILGYTEDVVALVKEAKLLTNTHYKKNAKRMQSWCLHLQFTNYFAFFCIPTFILYCLHRLIVFFMLLLVYGNI